MIIILTFNNCISDFIYAIELYNNTPIIIILNTNNALSNQVIFLNKSYVDS